MENYRNKILYYQCVINKTIISSQKYKLYDILGPNELNISISTLEIINENLNNLMKTINENSENNEIEKKLHNLKGQIIEIIKNFGTESFSDLLTLLFEKDYVESILKEKELDYKFKLMENYVHPINYKIAIWKNEDNTEKKKKILPKNRIIEDIMICESAEYLECFDLARTSKSFQTKVYGMKVCFHDVANRKTYIIFCIVDDIIIGCLNNEFIKQKMSLLEDNKPSDNHYHNDNWNNFILSLTIKDIFVYSNSELYNKYENIINQLILIKQKSVSQVIKEFINSELYSQRSVLIQLLIKNNDPENLYLAYLLYDILSNENNGNVDTLEQTLLFDSLPWNIKKKFRDAMKQTIQYTNNLYNFDSSKIPLEQQICLLKASDNIKEKAVLKLKEVKAKSEDSGSKARQYLDGLLKIPFGILKEEEILNTKSEIDKQFNALYSNLKNINTPKHLEITSKNKYTNIELVKNLEYVENYYLDKVFSQYIDTFKNNISHFKKDNLQNIITFINNTILKKSAKNNSKLPCNGKKINELQDILIDYINSNKKNYQVIKEIYYQFNVLFESNNIAEKILNAKNEIVGIKSKIDDISLYMKNMKQTLNDSVYGHEKAKRQLERIIGQWINGEKSGYCFGFEGPPGVGKTSLAKKGIANCLKDKDGKSRPLSFIAIGGSSNGSTLEGHNYTYVGSTWGRIVDILIETNCMNPIIFIDELDKISKTEHGKEIIGILTHLIDPTQNDSFQDKYFSGVDLDLSKALFIFSYNDVDKIDRILLDRIHRIKFKHLSMNEKLIITDKYILPEIYQKMGFDNILEIDKSVVEFIINKYTNEPGVRKLKELLFEIIGEINLTLLTTIDKTINFPIKLTIDDVRYKYLKDRPEHRINKINQENYVGVINGLWANNMGQGGLLNIESKFIPSSNLFDLKLTGMQGDVMKESMFVAKSLVWSLLSKEKKQYYVDSFEKEKNFGIHIHVPEGSTPKDGPSAGAAITTVIYSLLTNRRINKDFSITGEICLKGKITAIGGLDLKILGGIEAGATKFIYPSENSKDYQEFYDNLDDKSILKDIYFYEVSNIEEVLEIILLD
tara:strand:- start:18166 stop:21396 length:3231 start_codon:yes stop_codon:yes gene_type:complete